MKKFFSSTKLKVFFCISIALFLFLFGCQNVFAMTEEDSLELQGTVGRVYTDDWTNVGAIVMPIGNDQTFIGRMSVTWNAQQESFAWSYSPFGDVQWDIYTRQLSYSLISSVLVDQKITVLFPSYDADLDEFGWSDPELVEIPMSYFFNATNYLGTTMRFTIRDGQTDPGNLNRFYFLWNFTNYDGTYETWDVRAEDLPWDAQNTQQETDYGSHPKLTWIINAVISLITPSLDYAESSALGYSALPKLTWYPFFELENTQQTLDNALNQEIVQKLDTIDDTLNLTDQRASAHSGGSGVWFGNITNDLADIDRNMEYPDVQSQMQGVVDEVTTALNNTYSSRFLNWIIGIIQNNSFIFGLLSASLGLGLIKFIIFGKG